MKRKINPILQSIPAFEIKGIMTNKRPIGISLDANRLYAIDNTTLQQSTDDGVTWTNIAPVPAGGNVRSLIELDDGEALLNIQGGAASPGYLYRSSGWSTNRTTATWTLVLTSVGGYFDPNWSVNAFTFGNNDITPGSSKYGVVCEYGSQTSSSGDQTNKARRVYFTDNFGVTWTQIFDLKNYYPNAVGLHCHAAAYDPYWDRIWLTWGDTQTNTVGAQNFEISYSDDHGATWTALDGGTAKGDGAQVTSIAVLSDCIVFGGDNRPGLMRLPRKGYRQIGVPQVTNALVGGTGAAIIGTSAHKNIKYPGSPTLMGFQGSAGQYFGTVFVSIDGLAWSELYRERTNAASYVNAVFGPTSKGVIVFNANGTSVRGQMVEVRNRVVLPVRFVGDGTTTTFVTPHNYGARPRNVEVFNLTPSQDAHTVTWDDTNITITMTTAPVLNKVIWFDLRYS